VDLNAVLEQFINNLRIMRGCFCDGSESDAFAKVAMVFESVKSWKKSIPIEDESGISGVFVRQFVEKTHEAPMQDIPLMNIVDDTWLSEELGSWSYDFISRT
jgi:hypothetical protein